MNCGASDLVVAAAVLSVILSEGRDEAYLNYMGSLLMMVGQNMTTMAEAKAFEESCKKPGGQG